MFRLIAFVLTLGILGACTNPNDLDKAPVDLGNFALAHNVVVAPNLTKGPASRNASKEEWIEAMKGAIQERFGRYEGDKLYHLGISVEGYVLAIPGVPIVASPKSALILNVTVWDDAAGEKLNDKPHQVTVIESFSGNTFLGSGLTQSKAKQMENLTRNAAKQIQNWVVQQNFENEWFGGKNAPATKVSEQTPEDVTEDEQPLNATSSGETETTDGAAAAAAAAAASEIVADPVVGLDADEE